MSSGVAESEAWMTAANHLSVRRVLEPAGIEIIDGNAVGTRVGLRKPQAKKVSGKQIDLLCSRAASIGAGSIASDYCTSLDEKRR